jgi:serine/threonine protein kinase
MCRPRCPAQNGATIPETHSGRPAIRTELTTTVKAIDLILQGVSYIHANNIIHRDIKSSNILFNSLTDLALSDFGIGRAMDSDSTRETQSGYGLGSFNYMAPEQFAHANHADQRSDIYAIGRVIYELYTGPLTSPLQDVDKLHPGALKSLVSKCTQIDPNRRFRTVYELFDEWERIKEGLL